MGNKATTPTRRATGHLPSRSQTVKSSDNRSQKGMGESPQLGSSPAVCSTSGPKSQLAGNFKELAARQRGQRLTCGMAFLPSLHTRRIPEPTPGTGCCLDDPLRAERPLTVHLRGNNRWVDIAFDPPEQQARPHADAPVHPASPSAAALLRITCLGFPVEGLCLVCPPVEKVNACPWQPRNLFIPWMPQ